MRNIYIKFFQIRFGLAGLIGVALVLTVGQASSRASDLDFFVEAVRENRIDEVRTLIEKGIDVNARDIFGDNTGLHWAAKFGLAEMARLLIDNDAVLDIRNREGDTPLHWAVGEGQKELVVILIIHGADVNARGHGGWTPLRWAYRQRQNEIARILVAAGAY